MNCISYKRRKTPLLVPENAEIIPVPEPRKPHIVLEGKELKHCPMCGKFLPPDLFYNNSSRWDGKVDQCKECNNGHKRRS